MFEISRFCKAIALCIFFASSVFSQTPVNMASQPSFTYKETFADIANWTFNTALTNGTFSAGIGANAWRGVEVNATGSIPSATRITVASTNFQVSGNPNQGSSSGFYKGTQNINLLSTGTTDNTSSIALDFFVDFTGLNAGTLSFDWASLNNSSGNRNGSLRVYASVDGTNYSEIIGAAVLNFTNNNPTAGTVSFVALPSIFNNAANARLRFYYHNGTGGSSGSRPRISLDNIQVTATPTNVCTAPTTQPTNFIVSNNGFSTIDANFTAPSINTPQGYLVVMSVNSSLSGNPINGKNYALGDNIGDGTVVSVGNNTSFSTTGLSAATTYYFFIFSMNNLCSGGPLYLTQNPLQGFSTTLTGNEPCTAPSIQASALTFSNIKPFSVFGSFTAGNASDYLVVRTTTPTLSATPVNRTNYNAGATLGNGTVVSFSQATSFTANNLNAGTTYYFHVFAANKQNCLNGPTYNTNNPLVQSITTTIVPTCVTPTVGATNLQLTSDANIVQGYFTPSNQADDYLVLMSTNSSLSSLPVNGVNYTKGSTLGNASVVQIGNVTAFIAPQLTNGTTYYFYVIAANKTCDGGTKYLTSTILQATITTPLTPVVKTYFGNLHAHSSYSDGNQDNSNFTPANNYAFAKNSMCMDFLGISEHNHSDAGMNISNWQPGLNQAAAATTSNFLGLYGMEWGVISGGGHLLVYGTNQLLGWENGNYNTFVPKNDYIGTELTTGTKGLFRTINLLGNNAVVLLAHPNSSDYNNLSNISFNATADSAIVGAALANGPSTSTNTTYSDPGSSLAYYDYFKKMLARGYHIGPSIDHDNHNTTFGRTAYSRLAVNSTDLSSNSFLSALKSRNFYATEDCDTKVIFTINNQPMGSIFSGTTTPAISVYATDPTNTTAIPQIKIMYGIPGSSVYPVTIDSVSGFTHAFTDFNLPNTTTAYYYAEITIAGNKIISAPIWYTYNNGSTLPVELIHFKAKPTAQKTVLIEWNTVSETNNKYFIVEKSTDGTHFSAIDTIMGKGNTSIKQCYNTTDVQPIMGKNYYRLVQVNVDGSKSYSAIITAVIQSNQLHFYSLVNNPVLHQKLQLNIHAGYNQLAKVTITDLSGKTVGTQTITLQKGHQLIQIPTTTLSKGTYSVSVHFGNTISSKLFIQQ